MKNITNFKMKRLGILMEPEKGNLMEEGGVLNPAAVRGKDGELYLFPRIATKDNYSRIAIVKVKFDNQGEPVGVLRKHRRIARHDARKMKEAQRLAVA